MGFIGLIRSIEDLLYEFITWIVFYPRTLLRVMRHPLRMIDYSDREQGDASEEQYTDTLSPPIFLILTILLAHGVELALGQKVETPGGALGRLFSNSEELLLFYRVLSFSIFPVVYAVALVKRSEQELTRTTLRGPFFGQCYLGALFAILVSVTTILGRVDSPDVQIGAVGGFAIGLFLYLTLQGAWLRSHLSITRLRAGLISVGTFFKGGVFVSLIAALVAA